VARLTDRLPTGDNQHQPVTTRWDQALFWSCYAMTLLLLGYTVLNMHKFDWLLETGWFVLFGWIMLTGFLWILLAANINLKRISR
jgi:hypothetical protein